MNNSKWFSKKIKIIIKKHLLFEVKPSEVLELWCQQVILSITLNITKYEMYVEDWKRFPTRFQNVSTPLEKNTFNTKVHKERLMHFRTFSLQNLVSTTKRVFEQCVWAPYLIYLLKYSLTYLFCYSHTFKYITFYLFVYVLFIQLGFGFYCESNTNTHMSVGRWNIHIINHIQVKAAKT